MRISHFDRIAFAEITRPANTSAYSANEVIAAAPVGGATPIIIFPNAGRSPGATGYIRSIRLLTNLTTCTAAITVWLYNSPNITVQADGITLANQWAERQYCLGSFTMPALAQPGNSSYALAQSFLSSYSVFSTLASDTNGGGLYAQMTAGGTFTPAASQIFRLELGLHQNEYQ